MATVHVTRVAANLCHVGKSYKTRLWILERFNGCKWKKNRFFEESSAPTPRAGRESSIA
jgi:hypothetical protein